MGKGGVSTGGDEAAAKLTYFKFLVQAIRDDDHIAMRSAQAESSIAQQDPLDHELKVAAAEAYERRMKERNRAT